MKSLVRVLSVGLMSGVMSVGGLAGAQTASADDLGYLVNIFQVRGINFPDPGAAVAYGQTICMRVGGDMSYVELMNQVKAEVGLSEFLAGYLISQAAEELCPEQIWQLRNSAAGYTPA
ncbi:MAG: DUF732 domain-containing protein [Actinomycetia bacterium]|nr:DUF732 domain-containing protein [Actinomycetes bacterium]